MVRVNSIASFTYDADGNMTGDGRFTYTWNDENSMASASNAEVCVSYDIQ